MYRVLIADDENIVIESLRFIINSKFEDMCEIETAKTGRAVIELAETFRPDIAFMDIHMPGINGIEAMKEINEKKAKILYDFLDSSKLFKGTVVKEDRSLMNVPFVTGNEELDAKFVKEAKEAGFENLKGHRTVGGMRASIYNAMPIEGVQALVDFMKKFEEENA